MTDSAVHLPLARDPTRVLACFVACHQRTVAKSSSLRLDVTLFFAERDGSQVFTTCVRCNTLCRIQHPARCTYLSKHGPVREARSSGRGWYLRYVPIIPSRRVIRGSPARMNGGCSAVSNTLHRHRQSLWILHQWHLVICHSRQPWTTVTNLWACRSTEMHLHV